MAKQVKSIETPNLAQALTPQLLGIAIRARRTQSKLRLADAAALCGVAKQTLSNIEKGHSSTQINTILQVCFGLGIKLHIQSWNNDGNGDVWY